MPRRPFQLSPRHRAWVYGVLVLLFSSGFVWWMADEAQEESRSPVAWAETAKPWLMRVHVAAAFAFLVVLGTLLPSHADRAWAGRVNRASGLFLGTVFGLQALTAYGLRFFPTEVLKDPAGTLHVSLGLLLPLFIGVHVVWGRRVARKPAAGP